MTNSASIKVNQIVTSKINKVSGKGNKVYFRKGDKLKVLAVADVLIVEHKSERYSINLNDVEI